MILRNLLVPSRCSLLGSNTSSGGSLRSLAVRLEAPARAQSAPAAWRACGTTSAPAPLGSESSAAFAAKPQGNRSVVQGRNTYLVVYSYEPITQSCFNVPRFSWLQGKCKRGGGIPFGLTVKPSRKRVPSKGAHKHSARLKTGGNPF